MVTGRAPRVSGSFKTPGGRRYADAAAVLLLLVLTAISQWDLLRDGTIVGMDSATQYLPWYSHLGESLRSGEIPAWNPSLFSGAPFAADPLSGWTYLPAMLLFAILPLSAAAKAYMFLHPLMAGLFAYALARSLRMGPAGGLVVAVSYGFSGYVYVRNTCCFPYVSVPVWLPLAILGAEMAIRSTRWPSRGLWWGVCGLALSQILASWLGQGSYYALLALGSYVAYRTLLFPPDNVRGVRHRLPGLLVHGGAVLLFGFGLAAAGVLPRLEYNAFSNLADGYPNPTGGWSIEDWNQLFAFPTWLYAGTATLALALAAPLVVRGRFAVPYFAALAIAALTLSGDSFTLLHYILNPLPRFEQLHQHYPQRAMLVFYLSVSMIAGATVTVLGERSRKASLVCIPFLAAAFLLSTGNPVPPGSLLALIIVLLLTAAYALIPTRLRTLRGVAAALLILTLFSDLYVAGSSAIEGRAHLFGKDRISKVDLDAYYAPTGATRFLQGRGKEPSRYFGYDPLSDGAGGFVPTYMRFSNPEVRALEAENRAILGEGLQSIQGYNAVHLARYDEYLAAMNGRPQNYHDAEILPDALDSPLLDLLNVRHVIVQAGIDADSAESLQSLERELPTVYEDDTVKILENREALPRAWIVHAARKTGPEAALRLLASGAVDPRETVLLERQPPELVVPEEPSEDRAAVVDYGAHRVEIEASTGAPGMLVLSEVYYPAWKAYVDGRPAPLYRADHLLRAVPVPPGEHTVEVRYESTALRAGLGISSVAYAVLGSLLAIAGVRRFRDDRRQRD